MLAGFLISLIGSLPLGIVNVCLVRISAVDGTNTAIHFAIGSLAAEVIYIRGTLALLHKFWRKPRVMKLFQWISLLVLCFFALAAFFVREDYDSYISISAGYYLIPGFLLMIINPVQIPFWAGWSVVLLEKNMLKISNSSYNVFTLGAAVGAFTASLLFILGGQVFENLLISRSLYIYPAVGIVLFIGAAYQFYKIVTSRSQHLFR